MAKTEQRSTATIEDMPDILLIDGKPAERELRIVENAEFRAETRADGTRVIRGLGIVFGKRSENLGGFFEVIDARALDDADMTDVVALFNHDPNFVLGRSIPGTPKLKKTKRGLEYEIELPDTQIARDLYTSIERGDVRGSSFAFNIEPGGAQWDEDPDTAQYIRTVNKIRRVFDVSPVTYPAYKDTDVSAAKRSLDQVRQGNQTTQTTTASPSIVAEDNYALRNQQLRFQLQRKR